VPGIVGMGVTSIAVNVRPREAALPACRRQSLLGVLVRTPPQVMANHEWSGGGNSAYGVLYAALQVKLLAGFLTGFKDEGHGLKFPQRAPLRVPSEGAFLWRPPGYDARSTRS
jgi:hypothetical protein